MAKTVTLRLTEEEYQKILSSAQTDHRPISNFITHVVLKEIDESYYLDEVETAQIKSDEKLLKRLKAGHKDAQDMKGKLVE